MKTKSLLTLVLLGFATASIAAMIWKEVRPRPVMSPTAVEASGPAGTRLIAYYFHGKVRCTTCNDIEQAAREAVQAAFQPELNAGRLEWRVIDYDAPGNAHYATDYQLAAPCVVLASIGDNRQESWTSLPEVWELISDPPAFRQFIQQRVAERLGKSLSAAAVETPALPKLLDLGAGRCIPCKQMAPILEELRENYEGRFEVVFLDVWEDPKAAESHGVSTIPTQIFFDAEGKERFRHEGFFSREEILATWQRLGVDIQDGPGSH